MGKSYDSLNTAREAIQHIYYVKKTIEKNMNAGVERFSNKHRETNTRKLNVC